MAVGTEGHRSLMTLLVVILGLCHFVAAAVRERERVGERISALREYFSAPRQTEERQASAALSQIQ